MPADRTEPPADRWTALARACGAPIPRERLARIAPILDALQVQTRAALDRDLTLVEPVAVFTPGRRSR